MSDIEICDVCHVSFHGSDLFPEFVPYSGSDPDFPSPFELCLICHECFEKREKLKVN